MVGPLQCATALLLLASIASAQRSEDTMSCAFVDCQDKCLTFANNLGSKKDEVCGEGAGMDIDGGDEPAKEDGVNYIAATTCMYKNDECSAMDSDGKNRIKALEFDCSIHAKNQKSCEDDTKISNKAVCEFVPKDGEDDESFNECVKTKTIVNALCGTSPEEYGCPSSLGCEWDSSDITKEDKPEKNECTLAKSFGKALKTCVASTCEGVKTTSVAGCTEYSKLCSALVFKESGTQNVDPDCSDDDCDQESVDQAACTSKASIFADLIALVANSDKCDSKCTEETCEATSFRGVDCFWEKPEAGEDGEEPEGGGKCKFAECLDYKGRSACNGAFVNQGCLWGKPGECALAEGGGPSPPPGEETTPEPGTTPDEGQEPEPENSDDDAKCKVAFNENDCTRTTGLTGTAKCEWTAEEGDGETTGDSCFQISAVPCNALETEPDACNSYEDPEMGENICVFSPGPATIAQEVVCYDTDDFSVEDLCHIPNAAMAERNGSATPNRLWTATAKLPLGTRYVVPEAPPTLYRADRCAQLIEQDIDCEFKDTWPFNEDRASCVKKDYPCRQIGFKGVCEEFDNCEWNAVMRGPQGEIGVCMSEDDDVPSDCGAKMCIDNCDEDKCSWSRGPDPRTEVACGSELCDIDSCGDASKNGKTRAFGKSQKWKESNCADGERSFLPPSWISDTQPEHAAYNALVTTDGSEPKYECTDQASAEIGIGEYAGWSSESQEEIDRYQSKCRDLTNKPVQCNCNDDCHWVGNQAAGRCLDKEGVNKVAPPKTCDDVNAIFNVGWPYPMDKGFSTKDKDENGEFNGDNNIDLADMDQAEDTVYPIYVAYEDACQGIGWKDGEGGDCKIILGDLNPYCVPVDSTETPCTAYGRSPLSDSAREGSEVGPEYTGTKSECESQKEDGTKCVWYPDVYKKIGAGCYKKDEEPDASTSTTTATTKTVVTTTTTTTIARKVTSKARITTTSTATSATSATTTTTATDTTVTETVTTTSTPPQARTEPWNNPLCKKGARGQNPEEQAIINKCPSQGIKPIWSASKQKYFLMVPVVMKNEPVCVSKSDPTSSRLQPCLNARVECVHTNCSTTRDAIKAAATNAVNNLLELAAGRKDPTSCYKKQGKGWDECSNFVVPDVTVEVDFYYQKRRRRSLPYPKSSVPFQVAIGASSEAQAITTRIIMDTLGATNFNKEFMDAFKDYADDVLPLIKSDWRSATQAAKLEFFVSGENGRADDRSLIRFDTLPIDFGSVPSINDAKVYNQQDVDQQDDDFTAGSSDQTWDSLQYDLKNSEAQKLFDATQEDELDYSITATTLFTASSKTKLDADKARLDERMANYQSVVDTLQQDIDNQNKKAAGLNDDGLTKLIQDEVDDMEELKDDAASRVSSINTARKSYEPALNNIDTKGGEASAKTTIKTGSAVAVLVVILLLMGGGTFFFVLQSRKGKAKYKQSLKKGENANPAYEPGNAPQNAPQNAPAAQRKPSGGDVIQQGQRKVLVLDPYGDQAPNEA